MARPYAVVLALRAVDMASASIRKVSGSLADIRGRAALFSRSVGVHRVADRVKDLVPAFGGVATAMKPLAGLARASLLPLLIASTGATGGVGGLLVKVTQLGDRLADLAARTDMTATELQGLMYAAERKGGSGEAMVAGLRDLQKNIGEAANGTGEARELFKALGIELKTTDGRVRASRDVLLELADKMKLIPNAAVRAAVANKLLGGSGHELVEVLSQGRDGIERLAEAKRRFGMISQEQAEASGDFNDKLGDLREAVFGVAIGIQARLLPVFSPLIDYFTELVVAVKPQIVHAFSQALENLAVRLSRVDWVGVGRGVWEFGARVMAAIEWVGGFGNALMIAGALMAAPMLLAVLNLSKAVALLGFSLAAATVKTLGFAAVVGGGGLIGMIGTFIAAIKQGTGVVFALNYAMTMNPVGALVMALIAAAGLVIAFWDPIKAFFVDLFATIRAKLAGLASMLPAWAQEKLGFTVALDGAADEAAAGRSKAALPPPPVLPPMPDLGPSPPAPGRDRGLFPPPPDVRAPQAAAPGVLGGGNVTLTVRFENAPAGTRVERRGHAPGLAIQTEVNVGRGLGGSGDY